MKTKLTGSLAIALTLTMLGYMSLSIKSANAQEKTSVPAKSLPAKSAATVQEGAGISQAPTGAGKTTMLNIQEPEAVKVKGGCCS